MTKKKAWTEYDPETAVVDRRDAAMESLCESTLDEYWRKTMRQRGFPMPTWVDRDHFRNTIGNLGRALGWLSERLGVCVLQVLHAGSWAPNRGPFTDEFHLRLLDANGDGDELVVVIPRDDFWRENVVRRAIFEATGLTVPDHHCLHWHDLTAIVWRCAEWPVSEDNRPTSGHLQDLQD